MFKRALYKFNQFFLLGTNRSVFVICFLTSSLFWYLIKFSKDYTDYLNYHIEFVNTPIDKFINDNNSKILKVKVNGFGFSFLRQFFKSRILQVDFSRLQRQGNSSSYFWLSEFKNANLTQDLDAFSILEINPDTLFFNFSTKTKRVVKVKVPTDFNYKETYAEYGEFKILPSFINIYGPSHLIDTISFVHTEKSTKTNVTNDIEDVLPLYFPNKLISSDVKEVQIIQQVARFTQKTLSIPIDFKNVPIGKKLKIKPDIVKLSFWVALQDIDKVNSSDFKLYCDYNESEMTESTVLNVFLDTKKIPSIVQRVKFHPSTIEFIKMN